MVIPSGQTCPFHTQCPNRVGDGYDNCPRGAGGHGDYVCSEADYLEWVLLENPEEPAYKNPFS